MVLKLKNILAAILFSAVLISAQEQDIYFTQTNIIDGLPGDHPFRLLEDRYGYIWMTAETGVFRYDGYEYRNFLYDENDPTSFSGEIGGNICEDATGKIWISHRDGLEYYDYNIDGFVQYNLLPDSLNGTYAVMAASKDSSLYISISNDGIFQINKYGKFDKVNFSSIEGGSFFDNKTGLIFFDNYDRLWMAQYNYFLVYDQQKKNLSKIYLDESIKSKNYKSADDEFFWQNPNWINTFFIYNNKEIWVGTKDGRVFIVKFGNDITAEEYRMTDDLKKLLNGKEISGLFISEENKLWISIDDFTTGLVLVDLKDGSYEHIEAEFGVQGSISRNRIHQIYQDQFNTLWLPAGRGGINRWDPYANKFSKFFDGTKNNLKSNIGRFLELDDGTFLITDRDAKIYKFNPYNNKLTLLKSFDDNITQSGSNNIRTIIGWKENKFFLTTIGAVGLLFDLNTKSYHKLKGFDESVYLYDGVVSRNDVVWYSGKANNKSAIISYNINTGKSNIYYPVVNEQPHPGFNYTYTVIEDRFGKIWTGTNGKGFFRFDPLKNEWLKIDHPQLTTVRISYEASDGNIWAGSSKGLFVISSSGEIIKKFTTREGLLHEMVSEITEDDEKNIWVQSERGISRINMENYEIRNFGEQDGYPIRNATNYDLIKIANGKLVFISEDNLLSLSPKNIKDNKIPPLVSITELQLSGNLIEPETSPILGNYIGSTKSIDLEYNQNDIELSYVGIHYSRSDRINYQYYLEGYDTEWQQVGKVRTARYTNLPGGEYTFMVKAQNADGYWNETPLTLAITIHPPFWQTWWAYTGYFLLLVGLLVTLRKIELKRRERKESQRLLEAENRRKTEELEEARQLQLSMLPKKVPQIPHLDIAVYMKTATEVGGDYYDFHVAPDGTLTVVLGDATGHGMKAGTMVTAVKGLFNSYSANPDILYSFQEISRCIKQMRLGKLSMCMTMLKINKDKMIMSAAGMPPIMIYKSEDQFASEEVIKGMPLGTFDNYPYEIRETKLKTGDTILLMSDGLPELQNNEGELYGYQRIRNLFENNASKTPEYIIDQLKSEGKSWSSNKEPDDDITFVVIKVK